MKFSVDAKSLMEAIGKARRVCPKALNVNLLATDKGGYLVVSADGVVGKFKISNFESEETASPITIAIDSMVGALRNRKVLNFDSSSESLVFDDGAKYSGKLTIEEYGEIEVPKPEGEDITTIDLSDETSTTFTSLVDRAYLTGDFAGGEGMTLYLVMGKKGITALCYDSFYLVRASDTSQEFEKNVVAIDLSSLSLITTIAGKAAYTLYLMEDKVLAKGSDFILVQPAIQIDNVADNVKNVDEFIDGWLSEECTSVTVEVAKLNEVLDNMSAFYEKGVPIDFLVGPKGVAISITGKGGELKEKVNGASENPSKTAFRCEYQLISELLPKIHDTHVKLSFIPDRVVYVQIKGDGKAVFLSAALVGEQ